MRVLLAKGQVITSISFADRVDYFPYKCAVKEVLHKFHRVNGAGMAIYQEGIEAQFFE